MQKELLLKEVNHRIKNSLQIVSSILHLQSGHVQNAESHAALQSASARVHAIAAVHERLYAGNDIRVVSLDAFIANLCTNIGDALGRANSVQVVVPTDMAIPLTLVVNELLTNAVQYGRSPYRVVLKAQDGQLVLTVGDGGQGPATHETRTGLGSRIVGTLAEQLAATLETSLRPEGYVVELTIPMNAAPTHEGPDSRG